MNPVVELVRTHSASHGPRTTRSAPGGSPAWRLSKSIFDRSTALLLVLLLVLVLLMLAAAIKLDSRGPVLFRQRRRGLGGRPFTVLKFRTMIDGAPPDIHRGYIAELANGGGRAGLKKLTDDPRITRVGRVLRRLSLDELPQLLNVLAGQMSLVGPRPAIDYELEHYEPHHFERFKVKPGLTGLWQVSGRSELGFLDMLELDVAYARSVGPSTDVRILVRTPRAIVGRRSA